MRSEEIREEIPLAEAGPPSYVRMDVIGHLALQLAPDRFESGILSFGQCLLEIFVSDEEGIDQPAHIAAGAEQDPSEGLGHEIAEEPIRQVDEQAGKLDDRAVGPGLSEIPSRMAA